ncbi:MAG: manganese efflux pump [Ruminococcaceae bacterium]|nr:manganese efflux pump [Oscillospiraceae bacterium]
MGIIAILATAVGLSMDAFAVAICKGLSLEKGFKIRHAVKVGVYFGLFQALMPLIGFFLGSMFKDYIEAVDHWVAFVLLCMIGINMLKEAFGKDEECVDAALDFKTMVVLAIATSIDAMAAGVALSMENVEIFSTVAVIGVTTFLFSFVGAKIGNVFGTKYKSKAEMAGGIILVVMAFKFLLEGLGIL